MEHDFKLLIDGKLVPTSETFPVINPATARVLVNCPEASIDHLNAAVEAARLAFPGWSNRPVEERASCIEALCDMIEARASELVRLMTAEQGKPIPLAAHEVAAAIKVLRAFRDMRLEPRVLRDDGRNKVIEHRTPLGVVAEGYGAGA